VACAVSRDNEKENAVVFDLCGLSLFFCKGDFCHLTSENTGQFERESITHTCVSGVECLSG